MKRFSAIALLVALLLSCAMTACGNADDSNMSENDSGISEAANEAFGTETVEEVDIFEPYRSIDLGGRTVKIAVSSNVSENGAGMPTSYPYIAGPEETTGESVQDNVYERNIFVEEMLNCDLEYTALDLQYNEVQSYIEKLVTAGDAEVDYCVNDQYGLLNCAINGSLLDLTDTSMFNEYYFDFDSDAYYTEYMAGLSVGSKRFIMTGDYFIDTMRAGHVLYMNKNIYGALFEDPEGIYKMILDMKWTMDLFNEIVTEAYQDLNGNGIADDEDSYGLSIHSKSWADPYYTFYYSTDSHVVDFDGEGLPYISAENTERMSKIAEYLIVTNQSKGTYKTALVGESLKKFVNGQSLFTAFQKVGDIEQASIRDFDGMGVIPYPMLDENQTGYRTLVHDTAEMGAFPITTIGEVASAASAVIQVMSVHLRTITKLRLK